jgi:diacylglycerol kinase family enzyme
MKIGVVRNLRSHAHLGGAPTGRADLLWAEPDTMDDLAMHLRDFAAAGVELLIVDGGDGTVRDVISRLDVFAAPPLLAVLPAGKTNVLAMDLRCPRAWTVEAVLASVRSGEPWIKTRQPLELIFDDARPAMRGFVMGLGAYEQATSLSKAVNRLGAFQSLSVALTLAGAVIGTLVGATRGRWRAGVPVTLNVDDEAPRAGARFLVMASTLKRLPLGIKLFGRPRYGLKYLDIDAPPRRLLRALPVLLSGRRSKRLRARGYRRGDAQELRFETDQPFVLDGEVYPSGGGMTVRLSPPLRFMAG